MQLGKLKVAFGLFIGILLLAFSSSHPTTGTGGYTTAPGDSACTVCHNNQSGTIQGSVSISGLPAFIDPNTTYPITITSMHTAGNPFRSGFQVVALDNINTGTGSVSNVPANAQLKTASGKNYVGHQPAQNFGANSSISWTYDWTSPAGPNNDIITFYAVAMLGNNNGSNSGDKFVVANVQGTLVTGGAVLTANITGNTDTSCSDTSDGTATVEASGGTPSYTYLWDNNETNPTAIELSPGLHMVTVTDNVNATATAQVTIGAPSELVAGIVNQSDISCFGASDGSATLSAAGGTPNYNFSWPGGFNGPTQANLAQGNYIITVSDANFCTTQVNLTINEPLPLDLSASSTTNVSCNGEADGSISVFPQGGTMPYFYAWSTGQNTSVIGNLPAGPYDLTVTDTEGCSATASFLISEPPLLQLGTTLVSPVTCAGLNNGVIVVQAGGGTGNYAYTWSNGATGTSQSNLAPGIYLISVTDENNCETSISVNIDVLSAPIEITIDNVTNVSCEGLNDGSIDISVTGGNGNFSYEWSSGQTTQDIAMLQTSVYTVTASDSNGCSAEATATVGQGEINISLDAINHLTCFESNDGSISISVSGGLGPYSFLWSNGETTPMISDLPSAVYTVIVNDNLGCSATIPFMVTQPNPLNVSSGITHVSCFGGNDGMVDLNLSGGTNPYTVNWSNGLSGFPQSMLEADTYILTVTDNKGCTTTTAVIVDSPPQITLEVISSSPVSCAGVSDGSIEIAGSGGTGVLSYLWPNGSTETIQSNVAGGDYEVSLTDEDNCTEVITVTIEEPEPFQPNATSTPVSSAGAMDGTAIVNPEGGTSPYTFLWSNGETSQEITGLASGRYGVTVTDVMGCIAMQSTVVSDHDCSLSSSISIANVSCNGQLDGSITIDVTGFTEVLTYQWSNGSTTAQADTLSGGIYNVTVQEGDKCQLVVSNVFVIEPGVVDAQIFVAAGPQCEDDMSGSLQVEIAGGSGSFDIVWSTGESTDVIENLGIGSYSVTVSDINECADTTMVELFAIDTTPPEVSVIDFTIGLDTIGMNELKVEDIVLSASDNCGSFIHTLSKSTFTCDDIGVQTVSLITSDESDNISETEVNITVVDLLAPTIICPADMIVTKCSAVEYALPEVSDNCATVELRLLSGLESGSSFPIGVTTMVYEAEDASGNTTICSFTITVDALITTETTLMDPSCPQSIDGSFGLSIMASNEPTTLSFINFSDPSNLSAGEYYYAVTDSGGCAITDTFTLVDPSSVMLTDTLIENASQMNVEDGQITIMSEGGNGSLSFVWKDENGMIVSTSQNLANIGVGQYFLDITDQNECEYHFGPFIITAPSGTKDDELNNALSIFPNPTNGLLNLQNRSGQSLESIQVISADGKIVKEIILDSISNEIIDLQSIPRGIYLLRINSNKGTTLKRVVLQY